MPYAESVTSNSAAESPFASCKRELVHRYRFAMRAEAVAAITAWTKRYNAVKLCTRPWAMSRRLSGSCSIVTKSSQPHSNVSSWPGEAQYADTP